MTPWIGVDLDGTLAHYAGWKGVEHIGEPVPAMVERIKAWVKDGVEVRIFTARVFCHEDEDPAPRGRQIEIIHRWLAAAGLPPLAVTCTKDFGMVELWDDRAVQIVPNTGRRADGHDL